MLISQKRKKNGDNHNWQGVGGREGCEKVHQWVQGKVRE
jgi:hypothetical protein